MTKDLKSKTVLILRIILAGLGFGWFISVYGVVMPWPAVAEQLVGLGADEVFQDRMLVYWFRMCACGFTGIGVMSFIMAFNPFKYMPMIIFYGIFMILTGIVLLVHGLLMGLNNMTVYFDFGFLFICGAGILLAIYQIRRSSENPG